MKWFEKFEETGWKAAIGLSIAIIPVFAWAAHCPKYMNEMVEPSFQAANAGIGAAVTAMDTSLSAILELQSERLLSAITVMTKQRALTANQVAESSRVSSQVLATGLRSLSMAERQREARFNFGGEFGQGYNPCYVQAGREVISNAMGSTNKDIRERVNSEIIAAPGRYGNRIESETKLIEDNQKFCTQSQADSGMCSGVGEHAGASISLGTLFTVTQKDDELYDAKVTYINNLFGLPSGELSQGQATSVATQNYILQNSRASALASPAMTSFKSIQLEYSGYKGTETSPGVPIASLFRSEIQRYAGNSAEHLQWARVLAAQNQRGLLVELLKVEALDLALRGREYEQLERMEAVLANLVAIEIEKSQPQNSGAQVGIDNLNQ